MVSTHPEMVSSHLEIVSAHGEMFSARMGVISAIVGVISSRMGIISAPEGIISAWLGIISPKFLVSRLAEPIVSRDFRYRAFYRAIFKQRDLSLRRQWPLQTLMITVTSEFAHVSGAAALVS